MFILGKSHSFINFVCCDLKIVFLKISLVCFCALFQKCQINNNSSIILYSIHFIVIVSKHDAKISNLIRHLLVVI